MAPYNYNLVKDELSLTSWLAIGAAAQVLVSLVAPTSYALVPVVVTFSILFLNFLTQYLGLQSNPYLKDAVMNRHSVVFPDSDGKRPEEMGNKPVAMFLVGIRSNHPMGRLHWAYRKLNDYLDDIYADAEANRATNGYLGRTPDWVNAEFSHNNTHCSISYWSSIEELEEFARRPVHLKGLKYLASALLGPKGHELGVIHEVLVCPPGHWEAIYANNNPWGFGATKFPMPKNRGLAPPIYERNPKVLNGMWGRMGNKLKQAEVDEKLAKLMGGQVDH
ncbi:hypothetical protein GGR56DRAFT_462415 [Xylariaceae sp. FL0804]|nr:hypothetical protein GGR56DRAFT_462415 [Xylariaceae sp. FL0804]